jgi:hypothetical protein
MLYVNVNFSAFVDAFVRADRGTQFSYEALRALYTYLQEEVELDIELDIIAICCEFAETTLSDFFEEYSLADLYDLEEMCAEDAIRDYLDRYGSFFVILHPDGPADNVLYEIF